MTQPQLNEIYLSTPEQGYRIIQICSNIEANKNKNVCYKYLDIKDINKYGGYMDPNIFLNDWTKMTSDTWDSYKNQAYHEPILSENMFD